MNLKNTRLISAVAALALAGAAAAIPLSALAQVNAQIGIQAQVHGDSDQPITSHMIGQTRQMPMMRSGIAGTVTAVSGTSLTVTGRSFVQNAATTTYSVDASAATVRKDNATSTVASIATGDMVFIQGPVTGTSIKASAIFDGKVGTMRGYGTGTKDGQWPGPMGTGREGSTTAPFQGNGQPVIAGTVSAVNGSSLTVATKSGTTYTVDISSVSKVVRNGSTILPAAIGVGDSVVVQGAVNGSVVSASAILDSQAVASTSPSQSDKQQGFFGAIGRFFSKMFGF